MSFCRFWEKSIFETMNVFRTPMPIWSSNSFIFVEWAIQPAVYNATDLYKGQSSCNFLDFY